MAFDDLWLYAIGSTVAISVFPFILLFFFKLDDESYLKVALG